MEMVISVCQAPGRSSLILILFVVIAACESGSKPAFYNADNLDIETRQGVTTANGKRVNGIVFSLDNTGDTLAVASYRDGKLHGSSREYYPNNRLKSTRYFVNGWKQDVHKGWFENGQQHFVYHFKDDMFHGNQREWLSNGMMYADLNYDKGQESGAQRVWYPNGKIKTNYIIKDNRRYGLLGTKNCVNASDSVFAGR